MVSRGDVWWYEPPDIKRRPALVMTRSEAAQSLNELIVILATTTVRGLSTEVELGPEDGMPRSCVLNARPRNRRGQDIPDRADHAARAGANGRSLSRFGYRDELLSPRQTQVLSPPARITPHD